MKEVTKKPFKKRNEKFSFKSLYPEAISYLNKSKNWIFLLILIFVIFVTISFFIPPPVEIQDRILDLIRGILEKTEGMSRVELILYIFFNNLKTSLFGMLFGFVLGIFSVLIGIVNGYVLGFVASKTVEVEGAISLWRLLPHGVFELPAVFISLGLGLKLGTFVFQKDKFGSFTEYLRKSLLVFLLIVIPLLIIAAIIEGNLIFIGR